MGRPPFPRGWSDPKPPGSNPSFPLLLSNTLFQRTDPLIPTCAGLPCSWPSFTKPFATAPQSPSSVIKLPLNFGLFLECFLQLWAVTKLKMNWMQTTSQFPDSLFRVGGICASYAGARTGAGYSCLPLNGPVPSQWYFPTKCPHPTISLFWGGFDWVLLHSAVALLPSCINCKLPEYWSPHLKPSLLPVDLRIESKILTLTRKALVFFISLSTPCSFWPQDLCTYYTQPLPSPSLLPLHLHFHLTFSVTSSHLSDQLCQNIMQATYVLKLH